MATAWKGNAFDFAEALLAFESGWDRDRFEAGIIQDWQLNAWAGGTVQDFYPQYGSWSELSDQEWEAMAYRSMNSLGFVGYQFGEALLIDLGYYDDDVYYGNGAAKNTWDGTWTGKNGVNSLEEFMTKEAQSVAMAEAVGFNLKVISEGLEQQGKSLDDYLGANRTYMEGGEPVEVTLTLSGIIAAAHLRGAYGTLDLLLRDSVTTDEYGTSILQYIDQFGSYRMPDAAVIIEFYESRLTGDEGIGPPVDPNPDPGPGPGGDGEAFDITWNWGALEVVPDFDPGEDILDFGALAPEDVLITEQGADLVIAVLNNGGHSYTLEDLQAEDLSRANLQAATWNGVIDAPGGVVEQLALMGYDDMAL